MSEKSDDSYEYEETQQRFKASLRGARIAAHKPMGSLTRGKAKKQRKNRAKKTV